MTKICFFKHYTVDPFKQKLLKLNFLNYENQIKYALKINNTVQHDPNSL